MVIGIMGGSVWPPRYREKDACQLLKGIDMDWDWNSITTGEWWVVLIALAMLLVGTAAGYVLGQRKAQEEYRANEAFSSTTRPLP
jgi:hypothetical protein